MFKNIIAATDIATGAASPVLSAIRLARQHHARLTVLHVLESDSIENREKVKHYRTNEDIMVTPDYILEVENIMQQNYENFLAGVHQPRFVIRTGYPWKEILQVAKQADTDLIVLGPHSVQAEKKGGVRIEENMGSTVLEVVAKENCPVMIVNKRNQKKQLVFGKIVVGIDFSISSECALCLSAKFSRMFGSVLYPFFMLPVPPWPKFTKAQYELNRRVQMEKLRDFCDFYLEGTDHEYLIQSGILPHHEIIKCAQKMDADLIMLGSHTKIKAGKWYAGSVVEQVGIGAGCPVMTVNDPEALHAWQDLDLPAEDGHPPLNRDIHLFDDRIITPLDAR